VLLFNANVMSALCYRSAAILECGINTLVLLVTAIVMHCAVT